MSHPPTSARRLLPEGLRMSGMDARDRSLVLLVELAGTSARCPPCGSGSSRVHSRYPRTLADLPWRGVAVVLEARVRRFFCENRTCERSIFCERLPDVAAHARKTGRPEAALSAIAFALGGEAGAKLAWELGLVVGPDALLGRIRAAAPPDAGTVRVLGLDDFALKRGHRYGTILVDLERRRVVDLLPDRTVPTVRSWLQEHPGVEAVARDRYAPYIEAADAALPAAAQVTDRWHLLKNLSDAAEKVLNRHRKALREAVERAQPEPPRLPWRWVAFLKRRWEHGGFDAEEVWGDLSTYCEAEVSREDFDGFVERLRDGPRIHVPKAAKRLAREEAKRRTPKLVARLLCRDPQELTPRERRYLGALEEVCSEAADARRLVRAFVEIVKERRPADLESWIAEVSTGGPGALKDFAAGLGEDASAVRAALSEEWSSGQVEGRVNKPKMLKRQMFGRANFDLLRARVLAS